MHAFTDNENRLWPLEINVSSVRRVKALAGVDLYRLVDDQARPLGELLADPCRLADVLFALVKPDADTKKITDESFGRALGGDVLAAATDAFLEELVDFFPHGRVRAALRLVLTKGKEVETLLLDRAERGLGALTAEEIARTLSGGPGNSPASSGSTPGPSPSGSSSG